MTGMDRLRRALSHQEGDRVPLDFWVKEEVLQRILIDLSFSDKEALFRAYGVDFRFVQGPVPTRPGCRGGDVNVLVDHWGVQRTLVEVSRNGYTCTYKHLSRPPMAGFSSAREVEQYDWPSPKELDFQGLEEEWIAFHPYAVVYAGDRLDRTCQLKTLMYLRGVEQALMDLVLHPKLVEAILERVREYYLSYNERLFRAAGKSIDLFMMGDDFGDQNGSLMSLGMWRKYFRNGFERYVSLAHQYGIPVMHHTCGSVREVIPDMIDCGLDVLQSLQPGAKDMDLVGLKREFGRDLCFHGGIDIQEVLPRGSPDDVRNHVQRVVQAGKPGGGYIACTAHAIQPDVSTENVLAMLEACEKYSAY